MSTSDNSGKDMHSADGDARRQAASLMGQARTERKAAAARANGAKNVFTEETRAKLREAQAARREREREERAALGIVAEPVEKKKAGRPKTRPDVPAGEKKPVGRPRKQQPAQITIETVDTAGNGAQTQEEG